MATNNQFSIAVHVMTVIGALREHQGSSSDVAKSVNANASFVRRILSKLAKAQLVKTSPGKGGYCRLSQKPQDITLLDIYRAVEAPKAFTIHTYPTQKNCTVSCNIKMAMEKVLSKTQKSLEESLKKVSLAEVLSDLKNA